MISPRQNIKQMLEKDGYPFKSKEHSQKVYEWHHSKGNKEYLKEYIDKKGFGCPNILKYQFTDEFKLNISHKCCKNLKKKPMDRYAKEQGKTIRITGMMVTEGGQRARINCVLIRKGKLVAFHPLAKVTKEWEEWFIQENGIKLCKLYYEPYNFERTGCKGCPFNLYLAEDLALMEKYLGNERKQAEYIFKPVYDEYRRIGYRLTKEEQTKLF